MSAAGLPPSVAVLAALGVAVLLWPAPRRWSGPRWPGPGRRRWQAPLPTAVGRAGAIGAAVVVTVVLVGRAGPALAATTVVAAATAAVLVRTALRRRRHRRLSAELLAATRQLAAELRAGAAPERAVQLAADAATPTVADGIRRAARTSRTDPDRGPVRVPSDVAQGLDLLAAGWSLAHRHGLSLATVVQSVVDQLTRTAEADERRAAEGSGARLSGHLLAALPLLGLVLGTGMGVDPVHVLLGTGLGNVALVTGTALTAAGLLWTAALSGRPR
ncbi:type II secretion system F family protein [Nakamurella leprariae]|uniref:Type II secretion system protein GspF domain-containing protein n=1 Tax=Nakamurella leprariae TaxID=2803911 RepID=A0A938YCP3_9ACTN|nr:hypothetical protein [Nakamurella leprariae]MBM9467404.1 hypothetical protein [Nakamurella leprariae]